MVQPAEAREWPQYPTERVHSAFRLCKLALPHLRRLSARFDETASLLIRTGTLVRCIASVSSTRMLRAGDQVGSVSEAHRSTGGLLLLGALDDETISTLYSVGSGESRTPKPHLADFLERLADVRQQASPSTADASRRGCGRSPTRFGTPSAAPSSPSTLALPSSRFEPALLRPILLGLKHAARGIEADRSPADAPPRSPQPQVAARNPTSG